MLAGGRHATKFTRTNQMSPELMNISRTTFGTRSIHKCNGLLIPRGTTAFKRHHKRFLWEIFPDFCYCQMFIDIQDSVWHSIVLSNRARLQTRRDHGCAQHLINRIVQQWEKRPIFSSAKCYMTHFVNIVGVTSQKYSHTSLAIWHISSFP